MTFAVTSLAEVWIEIHVNHVELDDDSVTSLAEVWIEIYLRNHLSLT